MDEWLLTIAPTTSEGVFKWVTVCGILFALNQVVKNLRQGSKWSEHAVSTGISGMGFPTFLFLLFSAFVPDTAALLLNETRAFLCIAGLAGVFASLETFFAGHKLPGLG